MKRVKKPDPVTPITDIEDEIKSDQIPGPGKRKTSEFGKLGLANHQPRRTLNRVRIKATTGEE